MTAEELKQVYEDGWKDGAAELDYRISNGEATHTRLYESMQNDYAVWHEKKGKNLESSA